MSELRAALAAATERLAAAGVPAPRFDAEELAAFAMGTERRDLWRAATLGAAAETFAAYVDRRAAREPLQHITGRAFFRHVTLLVGPGVFVPRPETELVAEAAIEEARRVRGRTPVVVDLCTGSGAIALSVADEVSGARVLAVEADPDAVAWAERNLAGSGVELRAGDMAEAFPDLDATVDVVVSNPPYIPEGAVVRDPEVASYDPAPALWSGADGLDAMRVVERVAWRLLRPGGLVVAEHADLQGESAPGQFRAAGRWADVRDHRDLAGRDRYLTARRR
ncbi:MAG: release factor glutamine methyltransferase [Actinomycetota bacterium]|nr:release factor glutamine methyltransferase [Actinomycetota bacterium]